jgi:hypothetical protein
LEISAYIGFSGMVALCLAFLGLFIRARLHDGFIFLWNFGEEEVELGGVSERFIQGREKKRTGSSF